MPIDPQGNDISGPPPLGPIREIRNADGSVPRRSDTLILPSSLVATYDADERAIVIEGGSDIEVPVPVDQGGTGGESAAEARANLGILDLTDEANAELAHANLVCGFTKPSQAKAFYNIAKIGTLGSDWTPVASGSAGLGNSTKGIVTSGWRGGANQITTGATGSSGIQLISCVSGLSLYGSAWMDDLVAATSKWHMEGVFRLDTAVDNQVTLGIGFFSPDTSLELWIGVRGASSTAKFRLYSGATGVNSTVNVDTAPHRFRMWGNGDTKIYGSVDYETPIELSGLTWGQGAAPAVQVHNGSTAAARTMTVGTIRYRAEGMVA